MPSVATQTASSNHPPLVEPGSPREPIQRDGPWTLWQHVSFKQRTRRGNMIRRWNRQGRRPPYVKLMRHCGINTPRYSMRIVAEMQSQYRSLLDMDPVQLELIDELCFASIRIRFWQRMQVDLYRDLIRINNIGAFALTSAYTCHTDIKALVDGSMDAANCILLCV